MKFDIDKCPECGEFPKSIVESVIVDANISRDNETGLFDYSGSSDVCWDTQEALKNPEKQLHLECPNYHYWYTDFLSDEEANA